MRRLSFIIFTTLIVASISFVDDASAKVFAPDNSPVFHTKDCKKLPSNIKLIEFPSAQKAIDEGAVPCPLCISQQSTGQTNQQSSKSALSNQGSNPPTAKSVIIPKVGIPSLRGKAYKTKIDSDHDDILKLDNGAIVEISYGYLGYVGYRKTVVLFNVDGSWKVWIEGKKTYKCEVLKLPDWSRPSTVEMVVISEVKGDGAILVMLDGSIYEVDSFYTIDTSLWLGLSDAIIIDGYELINMDEGDGIIEVTKLH